MTRLLLQGYDLATHSQAHLGIPKRNPNLILFNNFMLYDTCTEKCITAADRDL